jgi:hypothetical protein
MTKKILILLVAIVAIVALATAGSVTKGGTLSATCLACGLGGDPPVHIVGTGYQAGGHNQLTVVVWDSSSPVTCSTPDKQGNFTCDTNIAAAGWYNIVAYQNSKTIVAATGILIY